MLLKITKFDLAVIDSEYHFYPIYKKDIFLIFLNQSHDVIIRSKNCKIRINFIFSYLIEFLDMKITDYFSDLILVPVLIPKNFTILKNSKIRQIPLITRKIFQTYKKLETFPIKKSKLTVIFGGSNIKNEELKSLAAQKIEPCENLIFDSFKAINLSNEILIQGGLSSISECFALNKKFKVYPVNNHLEQHLNACEVNLINAQNIKVRTNGAEIAANEILSNLGY